MIFTERTLTLLTILILYLHPFTYTLHYSYLQFLNKQTGQSFTLLTILAIEFFFVIYLFFFFYLQIASSTYTTVLTLFTLKYLLYFQNNIFTTLPLICSYSIIIFFLLLYTHSYLQYTV